MRRRDRWQGALEPYVQSVAIQRDAALEARIGQIKQGQTHGAKLLNEGKAIYDGGRAAEALNKFKESISVWPEASNKRYVADLEARLNQVKSQATTLWNEGKTLYGAGQAQQALTKFKESLRVWPDPASTAYVHKLEAAIAQQAAARTATQAVPVPNQPLVAGLAGMWDTNIPGTVRVQLDFVPAGGGWTIRFYGRKGWEEMADVRVHPATGQFSFRRPLAAWGEPDQTYSDSLGGNTMAGGMNFTSTRWTGVRISSAHAGSTPAAAPSTSQNIAKQPAAQTAIVASKPTVAQPPQTIDFSRPEKVVKLGSWGTFEPVNPNMTLLGEKYSRYFLHHPGSGGPTEVHFQLRGQASSLSAVIGIDQSMNPSDPIRDGATVRVSVIGDGRVLWNSGLITATSMPVPVNVNLAGIQQLVLKVDEAGDGPGHDWLVWADPILRGRSGTDISR